MLGRLLRRGRQTELATSRLFNERNFYMQFKHDLERAQKRNRD